MIAIKSILFGISLFLTYANLIDIINGFTGHVKETDVRITVSMILSWTLFYFVNII